VWAVGACGSAMDRHSPFAPAYVRVLVLPVGRIQRTPFLGFLGRLRDEGAIVALTDITPLADDELLLHPEASGKGSLLYNYTTSAPSEQHQQLVPFELFREPLLVLGIADGQQEQEAGEQQGFAAAFAYLRERHPRVVHRQLVVLGEPADRPTQTPDSVVFVKSDTDDNDRISARVADANGVPLKDALCEISARFLKELSTYTKALQASPNVQTPGQTARSLQRNVAYRESERRPGSASGRSTPTQSNEAMSPVEDGSKQLPWNHGSPATSFDQIPGANSLGGEISRSDSQASNNKGKHGRATSQDRIVLQGFGSGTSQDKLKQKGKARVGIVIGSIYMMAGNWSEALRLLTEHTNKARLLSDHIWHAKGLENIIVCLLQHSWAGLEFQIPSICYSSLEKTKDRLSINLPSDFKTFDVAQQASVRSLSTSLPDLLKFTLSLYRSAEGPLELPFLPVAEATVRFGKLLAILSTSNGELDNHSLDQFITGNKSTDQHQRSSPKYTSRATLKGTVAEMVSQAQPSITDNVPEADHIAILAGIAAVLSLIGMDRKKGLVLKELLTVLTSALKKAQKKIAPETGVRPELSLTSSTGREAVPTRSDDGVKIDGLIAELARIYGFEVVETGGEDPPSAHPRTPFGGDSMKQDILTELASFCEASPDLQDVVRLNASLMRTLGRDGAVDLEGPSSTHILPKHTQEELTSKISRAVATARTSALKDIEARYWDQFLVRGVEIVPPEPGLAVFKLSDLKSITASPNAKAGSGNPLLYDPNASRPSTTTIPNVHILVQNEPLRCVVVLQNPYDVTIDIESLQLVTEGVDLGVQHEDSITLGPMRQQRVLVFIIPNATGDCKITGCKIKIGGFVKQIFRIFTKPWSRASSGLVKNQGQESQNAAQPPSDEQHGSIPEHATIPVAVVDEMPELVVVDAPFLDSNAMLFDGEKAAFSLRLKNVSRVAARLANIEHANIPGRGQRQIHRLSDGDDESNAPVVDLNNSEMVVQPGGFFIYEGIVVARPWTEHLQIVFQYGRAAGDEVYARLLVVPIHLSLMPSLRCQQMQVLFDDKDNCDTVLLCLELANVSRDRISYSCTASRTIPYLRISVDEGGLAPSVSKRVCLSTQRIMPDRILGSPEEVGRAVMERLLLRWHRDDGREGIVDLSEQISGSAELLDAVFSEYTHLKLAFVGLTQVNGTSRVQEGSFVTLQATLVNLSERNEWASKPLLLRLRHRGHHSRDFSIDGPNGNLHYTGSGLALVRPVAFEDKTEVDFVFCPQGRGPLELEVVQVPSTMTAQYPGRSRMPCRSIMLEVV